MNARESHSSVRPAAQAGRFYPADPQLLSQEVDTCLARRRAASPSTPPPAPPLALAAPHAGYRYSGRIAGEAYATLEGETLDGVLLLGPSHYVDFTGAALPGHEAFATPLGVVRIDRPAVLKLATKPFFTVENKIHEAEHSLEVQLPFLQQTLAGPFAVVPVALGRLPETGLKALVEPLSELLDERRAAGERWVTIASTDTYHGHDAAAGRANDARLQELIAALDPEGIVAASQSREVMACGWVALAVTMALARRQGVRQGTILARSDSQTESAESSSDYVVGYVAALFRREEQNGAAGV